MGVPCIVIVFNRGGTVVGELVSAEMLGEGTTQTVGTGLLVLRACLRVLILLGLGCI